MVEYRAGLPALPSRMRRLPLDDRGYPIPFFVAMIDGKPDFRVIAPGRQRECWVRHRCWLCGEPLGRYVAFTIGPMCAVNRITAEPPSHRECAEYGARACPFLTMPTAKRRDGNLPEEAQDPAGVMLARNPGMALIWIADSSDSAKVRGDAPRAIKVDNGVLFSVGSPVELHWYTLGRKATKEEVAEALDRGCPAVREVAEADGPEALAAFHAQVKMAQDTIVTHSVW